MLATAQIGKKLALVAILLALLIPAAWAAPGAGTVKTLAGTATISRNSANFPAAIGQRVFPGDRILTSADGYIGIVLRDDTQITLGPGGELIVREFQFNASTYAGDVVVSFIKGASRVVTGIVARHTPDNVKFNTATATIGIRGTDFIVVAGDRK